MIFEYILYTIYTDRNGTFKFGKITKYAWFDMFEIFFLLKLPNRFGN